MAWADSRVFRQAVADVFGNTTAMDLSGAGVDAPKVALYNNTPTPDKDVTAANSAYNVDQWVTAQEQYQAAQWAQGGVVLASPAITNPSTGVVMFDAADTASGAATTLSNVFGALVYDDTLTTPVADQGICFNYLGGSNSVVAGTFTVVWSSNGLWRASV